MVIVTVSYEKPGEGRVTFNSLSAAEVTKLSDAEIGAVVRLNIESAVVMQSQANRLAEARAYVRPVASDRHPCGEVIAFGGETLHVCPWWPA